jgi:hypothetical protein
MTINISAGTPSGQNANREQIPPITDKVRFLRATAKLEPEIARIPKMTRAIPSPSSDQSTDCQGNSGVAPAAMKIMPKTEPRTPAIIPKIPPAIGFAVGFLFNTSETLVAQAGQ